MRDEPMLAITLPHIVQSIDALVEQVEPEVVNFNATLNSY